MAEQMLELGQNLEIWYLHVDELREQDVNARTMPPKMFERLQATIANDKRLEALPLVAKIGENFELVSGHHRVRAARAAGVTEVYAMVDVSGLSKDEIAAKQLAHNSISGIDEPQLVKQIFEGIRDVDARLEAFIDPNVLNLPMPEKVSLPNLDLQLEYATTLITFLPSQQIRFDKAVEQILQQVDLERDHLYIADKEMYERWKATMRRLSKEYDARSLSTVIMRLLDAASEILNIDSIDPKAIDPDDWVPLASVLGGGVVPQEVATVVKLAVNKMLERGDITTKAKWRAIELWAADYLAGE